MDSGLRPLYRFSDEPGSPTVTEIVCAGCRTTTELNLADRLPEDDPDLFAYVMGMGDSIERLYDSFCARTGKSAIARDLERLTDC